MHAAFVAGERFHEGSEFGSANFDLVLEVLRPFNLPFLDRHLRWLHRIPFVIAVATLAIPHRFKGGQYSMRGDHTNVLRLAAGAREERDLRCHTKGLPR